MAFFFGHPRGFDRWTRTSAEPRRPPGELSGGSHTNRTGGSASSFAFVGGPLGRPRANETTPHSRNRAERMEHWGEVVGCGGEGLANDFGHCKTDSSSGTPTTVLPRQSRRGCASRSAPEGSPPAGAPTSDGEPCPGLSAAGYHLVLDPTGRLAAQGGVVRQGAA